MADEEEVPEMPEETQRELHSIMRNALADVNVDDLAASLKAPIVAVLMIRNAMVSSGVSNETAEEMMLAFWHKAMYVGWEDNDNDND